MAITSTTTITPTISITMRMIMTRTTTMTITIKKTADHDPIARLRTKQLGRSIEHVPVVSVRAHGHGTAAGTR
jgi:hypothetical protein